MELCPFLPQGGGVGHRGEGGKHVTCAMMYLCSTAESQFKTVDVIVSVVVTVLVQLPKNLQKTLHLRRMGDSLGVYSVHS